MRFNKCIFAQLLADHHCAVMASPEGSDAVQQTFSDDAEYVQDAEPSEAVCLESAVMPAPTSSETILQPEMISMPLDCSNIISDIPDTPLDSTDQIGDVLVSGESDSDLQPAEVETEQEGGGQVETTREVGQTELLLKLAETDYVCDNEESSQFSAGFVEDDNQGSVPPFAEHSEERGNDGSGLVQQATEEESSGVRDSQMELLLKPAETDSVCDNEESSQLSAGFVEDDNQGSVPPFAEHLEERENDGSGLVQQATEEESSGMRDSRTELVLKPAETEESSQLSAGFIEDDNHGSVPLFAEHSEECGNDSSGLVQQATEEESSGVRDSGEESQQLSCELGSRSQSPMSFVVQLNEDSECSLQSLPPGEHGPTNFSMKLSGLVSTGETYLTNVGHVTTAEYLEDDSRCSQFSERMNDEPDLLMEVETGSTMSEAVSIKDSYTSLDPSTSKATSTAARKSTGRSEDRNKSRIRKRLMVESAPLETEEGFVT